MMMATITIVFLWRYDVDDHDDDKIVMMMILTTTTIISF